MHVCVVCVACVCAETISFNSLSVFAIENTAKSTLLTVWFASCAYMRWCGYVVAHVCVCVCMCVCVRVCIVCVRVCVCMYVSCVCCVCVCRNNKF